MILFSDLHLRPESEEVCFKVLDAVRQLTLELDQDVRELTFLGDFFHVRYAVPVYLLNRVHRWLLDTVCAGIRIRILPGNHDQIDVGGQHAMEVFSGIKEVRVMTEPQVDAWGTWLPYRKDPNVLLDWIQTQMKGPGVALPGTSLAFMHHGIVGAMMNNGIVAGDTDGVSPSQLRMFSRVFCGHWHRHQTISHCTYVGSPWQTRPDEAGEQKGVIHLHPSLTWKFIPLNVGKKYHVVGEGQLLPQLNPGDVVKLPAGVPVDFVDNLVGKGVEVLVAPSPQLAMTRFPNGSTIREYAKLYLEIQKAADTDYLLKVFDEVAS